MLIINRPFSHFRGSQKQKLLWLGKLKLVVNGR